MPYKPSEEIARMYRAATGISASCRGVEWPKIETFGPIGMTAKMLKAANAEIDGASR